MNEDGTFLVNYDDGDEEDQSTTRQTEEDHGTVTSFAEDGGHRGAGHLAGGRRP